MEENNNDQSGKKMSLKKTVEKIDEAKSQFIEKINKTLNQTCQKKRQRILLNKIRNEKG